MNKWICFHKWEYRHYESGHPIKSGKWGHLLRRCNRCEKEEIVL